MRYRVFIRLENPKPATKYATADNNDNFRGLDLIFSASKSPPPDDIRVVIIAEDRTNVYIPAKAVF